MIIYRHIIGVSNNVTVIIQYTLIHDDCTECIMLCTGTCRLYRTQIGCGSDLRCFIHTGKHTRYLGSINIQRYLEILFPVLQLISLFTATDDHDVDFCCTASASKRALSRS